MVLSSRERESVFKISQSEFKTLINKYESVDIMYMSSHGEEIQRVLINEIDVDKKHSNTTQQLIHDLVAAPVVSLSLRNSPYIAKCFGPFTNSKVNNSLSLNSTATIIIVN